MANLGVGFSGKGLVDQLNIDADRRLKARGADVAERSVSLAEEDSAFKRQQAAADLARERATKTLETLIGIKEAFPGTGEEFQTQLGQTMEGFLNNIDVFGEAAGDPNLARRARLQLQNTQTAIGAATTEGTVAATAALAQSGALETGGVAPTAAATAAGIGEKAPSVNNFVLPDGTQEAVDMTAPDARQKVDDVISRGGVKVGFTAQSDDPGVFSELSNKEVRDFREAEIGTRTALSEITRVREQMLEGTLTGLAGTVVRELSNAAGSLIQLSRAAGFDDLPLLNPEAYSFESVGGAGQSAALKSNMVNLAYMLARAADPGGRLSDKDVQLQIDRLGGNVGDQSQMAAALAEVERSVKAAFRARHETLSRTVDVGELPPEFRETPVSRDTPFTDEELAGLPEGDRDILTKPADELTEADIKNLSKAGIEALSRKRDLLQ